MYVYTVYTKNIYWLFLNMQSIAFIYIYIHWRLGYANVAPNSAPLFSPWPAGKSCFSKKNLWSLGVFHICKHWYHVSLLAIRFPLDSGSDWWVGNVLIRSCFSHFFFSFSGHCGPITRLSWFCFLFFKDATNDVLHNKAVINARTEGPLALMTPNEI